MIFKEQFEDLWKDIEKYGDRKPIQEQLFSWRNGHEPVYPASVIENLIQKHCLSKQKVKGALNAPREDCGSDWPSIQDQIKEELGLK